MQDNQTINKRLAHLEFINDQLSSEMSYIDALLKSIGFSNGLQTIKEAARDLFEENTDRD